MHNAALAAVGLPEWRYQLLPLAPDVVSETLPALGAAGFRGVNVTIPHKDVALHVATDPGDRAVEIGAANTLVYADDGRIIADNTDAPALQRLLLADGRPVPGSALVLGAGGSAAAAVWALWELGVAELTIWNRTRARAGGLAARLGARAVDLARPADVLVNCTAVGLHGEDPFADDALPIGVDDVAEYGLVVDYVYAPGGTRLLHAARAAGVATIDGLTLLVAQGALSFELFTGRPAPREVMDAAARQVSSQRQ